MQGRCTEIVLHIWVSLWSNVAITSQASGCKVQYGSVLTQWEGFAGHASE